MSIWTDLLFLHGYLANPAMLTAAAGRPPGALDRRPGSEGSVPARPSSPPSSALK